MNIHSGPSHQQGQKKISRNRVLAAPQSRLIAYILDATIFGFTLGVGWFIWFLIIADRGTTPGHELMGHQVVKVEGGRPLTIREMLVREIFVKGILIWIVASFTMFLAPIADCALIFRSGNRTGHDYIVGSEVIQVRK